MTNELKKQLCLYRFCLIHCTEINVSLRERLLCPLTLGTAKVWQCRCVLNVFLSHLCTVTLVPAVSESSLQDDSDLSNRNGVKSDVSPLHMLIG